MLLQETGTDLGPAVVRGVREEEVRVDLHEEQLWARLALSVPRRPAEGDVVLVIGKDGAYYVIGLLETAGPTVISAPGDLELRADHGTVNVVSGRGVEVRAPRIALFARTLIQKLADSYCWVRNLLHVRTRHARTTVEETSFHTSERTIVHAAKDVKVDGEKIHLG